MKRTDIHRPSVINPQDYRLIAHDYLGINPSMMEATRADRGEISAFAKAKNIPYDRSTLNGRCQCCSRRALYYGVFYHTPSNTLVWLGNICAAKMRLVQKGEFVKYRKGLNTRVIHIENVTKARMFCTQNEINIEKFVEQNDNSWAQRTLRDLWFKCIQYHGLTEKQVAFCKKLIHQVENPVPIVEEYREAAVGGRYEVAGIILGFKEQESQFGITLKALIKTEKGWKLYVTVPSGAEWKKGDSVRIAVTVEVSKEDPFFAFGKRPKLAKK